MEKIIRKEILKQPENDTEYWGFPNAAVITYWTNGDISLMSDNIVVLVYNKYANTLTKRMTYTGITTQHHINVFLAKFGIQDLFDEMERRQILISDVPENVYLKYKKFDDFLSEYLDPPFKGKQYTKRQTNLLLDKLRKRFFFAEKSRMFVFHIGDTEVLLKFRVNRVPEISIGLCYVFDIKPDVNEFVDRINRLLNQNMFEQYQLAHRKNDMQLSILQPVIEEISKDDPLWEYVIQNNKILIYYNGAGLKESIGTCLTSDMTVNDVIEKFNQLKRSLKC
ncbi:MAG: hypothetical protein MJZ34_14475 [Paludibacteraceae bacterium]|nr:hypothetical protein [Paludibacteraceae bacterium]